MYGQRRKESGRNFSLPMHGSLLGCFVSWFSFPTQESEKQGVWSGSLLSAPVLEPLSLI